MFTKEQISKALNDTSDVTRDFLASDDYIDGLLTLQEKYNLEDERVTLAHEISATIMSLASKDTFAMRLETELKTDKTTALNIAGDAEVLIFKKLEEFRKNWIQKPEEKYEDDEEVSEPAATSPSDEEIEKEIAELTNGAGVTSQSAGPANLPGVDRTPTQWPKPAEQKPAPSFMDDKLSKVVKSPSLMNPEAANSTNSPVSGGRITPDVRPTPPKPSYGSADPYREPPV